MISDLEDREANPLFWVLLTVLFVGGLVGVSTILSDSETRGTVTAAPGVGDGSGVLYRGPAGTVASPHATGLPDGPSVTIIQDVRATMKRLPDRNTPKGWRTVRPPPR